MSPRARAPYGTVAGTPGRESDRYALASLNASAELDGRGRQILFQRAAAPRRRGDRLVTSAFTPGQMPRRWRCPMPLRATEVKREPRRGSAQKG